VLSIERHSVLREDVHNCTPVKRIIVLNEFADSVSQANAVVPGFALMTALTSGAVSVER
jgi:hypothetical protein